MSLLRFLSLSLMLLGSPLCVDAQTLLEQWRAEVAQARGLAENDIATAARKADDLAHHMPPDAQPGDRVRMLNVQARIALYQGDSAQTAQYAEQALALAREIGDRAGQAEADLCIVLNAVNQSRFDRMKEATEDSMVALQGVDRPDLLAEAMFRTSMMYLRYGQMDKALLMAMRNLETVRQSDHPLAKAYAHQGAAIVFEQSGRKAEARDHYNQMLRYAQDAHSSLLEADALISLGTILADLGNVASGERLVHEAIDKKYRKAGGPFYLAHGLFVLADFQRKQRRYRDALNTLEESVQIYIQRKNKVGLWWSLQAQSGIWLAMQDPQSSQLAAEHAYKLAREIGMPLYLGESTRLLGELAARRGEYQKAYRYATEAQELIAKSRSEMTASRIMELARQYETESKQRRIEELTRNAEQQAEQQRWLWTVLAATAALLALTVFFLLRLRKSRAAIRSLNASLEQRVQERTTELQESRQSLAEAQRIAHVGSWQMDLAHNVLTWSDEIYRIFEVDPAKFGASYEAFMAAVHPDDRKQLDLTYKEALDKHLPFEIEHRLLLPDARIKYVHERCETTYDDDGKPLRSIGTVQDITERKEMENALRESRQLMAESQRIAKVGSWEYDIASDTHTWSDELFRIYEIDAAAGASYDSCMSATHPDDRAAVAKAYLDAVETGHPYESEHRLLMKDGRIKYVHERGETVCDAEGRLLRAVGMMQDITERKQVEQKLNEALEFSEGIINAIPDILFEMDPEGRYLNVWTQNPDLLAAQRAQLLGKTVHEVLSPENAAAAIAAIRAADEKGYAQGMDIAIDLPGGRRWFSHTLSKKPGGRPGEATFLALSRDITERKELEERLAAREQAFRSLAESSPDFIVRYDREGRHSYLNNNLLSKLGISEMDELLGKRPGEVWTDGRFAEIEAAAARAAASGEMQEFEMSVPNESGGVRYTQLVVVPERSASGDIIGTIAFGHDITERRRMENELKESEARYRYNYNLLQAIIESPSDSVSIYAIDREFRLLAFNRRFKQAAKRLWGADIELGMNVLDAIDTQAHREIFRQGALPVLAGNHGFLESREERLEDGKPALEYHDNYGSPIYNDNGEVIGMTVFVLNTTERKRLEAELQESHNFLNSVIDAVPDPIFVKDREHRWTLLNEAFCNFTGLPRQSLLGKSDYDVFPKTEADVFWEKDELVFHSHEINLNEENFTSVHGERYFIQTKKTPFQSTDGRNMLVGVIRDITERKQFEAAREAALQEAVKLAKMRSDFLSRMSHELRTPLNGILGYTQVLQRARKLSGQDADALEVIRHSGEYLLSLIDDILDLARIDAGHFQLDSADIALPTFLRVVCDMVRIRAREKGLEFECQLPRDLPTGVRGDERRLRQILLNLLTNAIKFTEHGRVKLQIVRRGPGRFIFTVSDTGAGIPAHELERIFQPFEQASSRPSAEGTGLGLSICRELVRMMGGEISVRSTPGEGSAFTVELALPEIEVQAQASLPEPAAPLPSPVPLRLVPPPRPQLLELLELAKLGSMRDIQVFAERIERQAPELHSFAAHLRELAETYQSKRILSMVEDYLNDTATR